MPVMSVGTRPRRARRFSASRGARPQSIRTRVVPTSATRQLPLLPLPSEANRISASLQLLVQQGDDAAGGLRAVGSAVLGEDLHHALAGELADVHPVLLGRHLGIARLPERELGEQARLVVALLHVLLGIGVAHEILALLAVA